ncbi:hypothetical protein [Pectobacterium sp. B1J-3]|uniref:hypothetical protein n=1 Tax=Pectobacterium sp. B1J-3 TaxID=3385371 RepID=UPI003905F53C
MEKALIVGVEEYDGKYVDGHLMSTTFKYFPDSMVRHRNVDSDDKIESAKFELFTAEHISIGEYDGLIAYRGERPSEETIRKAISKHMDK